MAVMNLKYLDLFFGQDAEGTGITEMTEEYFRKGYRYLGNEPPTDGDMTWLLQQIMLRAAIGMIGQWMPGRVVSIGDVRYPNNLAAYNIRLLCKTAGTTGTSEPNWAEYALGDIVTESTGVEWEVQDVTVATGGAGFPLGHQFVNFDVADPDGCILLSTAELQRSMFQQFWTEHVSKKADLRTEAEYQESLARDGYVGFYSSGDGVNTFRTPTQKPYVSGLRDGFSLNDFTGDAIRNIIGTFERVNSFADSEDIATGAFSSEVMQNYQGAQTGGVLGNKITFDPSRVVPTSDENRPKTIYGRWYVKAFDTAITPGEADLTKLINDVIRLQTEKVNYTDFTQDFAENGWSKLPNGLIMQWCKVGDGTITSADIVIDGVFPISFPNACLNIVASINSTSGTAAWSAYCNIVDNSNFKIALDGTSGSIIKSVFAMAIGY